jgi:hypothetical protein
MCVPVQEASSSASRCEQAVHAGNRPPFSSSSDSRRLPSSIACVVDSRRGPSSNSRTADHRRLPSSRTCAAAPRRVPSSRTCAVDRPFERAIARRTGFVGDRRGPRRASVNERRELLCATPFKKPVRPLRGANGRSTREIGRRSRLRPTPVEIRRRSPASWTPVEVRRRAPVPQTIVDFRRREPVPRSPVDFRRRKPVPRTARSNER